MCNGYLLGKCWSFLQEKYPEEYVLQRVADPFPAIAFRAMGKIGEQVARISMDATQFGVGKKCMQTPRRW